MRKFLRNRYWLLGLMLFAACSQAGNPGSAGTGLAGGGGSGGGGTGGGTTVTALVSSGSALLTKFPAMARLQLSVTGAAGVAGIPLQLNLPTGGQALPLTLPVGVPLTFTFDVFDAAGAYLGTGTSTLTLVSGVNPVIPVNVNRVATPYTDPITGLTGTGPVLSLTVSVMTGASQQPIAGAVVSLGPSGTVTATTDASGIANFTGVPMPQDVHVFANGDGVSVLAFQGSALAVPMPENVPQPASVNVNSPAGPTLAAGELLDIYLTDGMSVQAIGLATGKTNPLRTSPAIYPMRGPVGISAMIENPFEASRVDHGLSLASAAGHHIVSPLNTAIADPYVQPRLGLQPLHISVASVPAGLSQLANVKAEVFAVQASGLYQFVSHKENGVLPANQRDIAIWPVAANAFVEHVLASDGYAQSEVWQRASTAAALTPPTAYPPVPGITAASAALVSWNDIAAYTWDGFVVRLYQGLHRWLIYGLKAPFTTAVTLPTVPAAAVNPLTTGVSATARVDEYVLDPAAGFSASSPDLWYLPRMLNERARSATFSFIP